MIIGKSSLLYIFQTQHLTTPVHSSPVHSPSLSTITLPLHSPSVSPPSRFLSLPHPFPSVSLTLFDQTPLLVLWSLPYPFRTLTVPAAVDYRYVALPFYCFVLHLMDDYQRGISHYQNLQFFFHFFYGYDAGSGFV